MSPAREGRRLVDVSTDALAVQHDAVAAHRLLNAVAAAQGASRALRREGMTDDQRATLRGIVDRGLDEAVEILGRMVRGLPAL